MSKNRQSHIIRKWVILAVRLFLAVATIVCAIKEDRTENFVNNIFVSHNELDPFNINEVTLELTGDFLLLSSIWRLVITFLLKTKLQEFCRQHPFVQKKQELLQNKNYAFDMI